MNISDEYELHNECIVDIFYKIVFISVINYTIIFPITMTFHFIYILSLG